MFTKNFSKLFFISILILLSVFSFTKTTNAQMMGWGYREGQNPPSQSDIQSEQNEQNEGQKVYQNLQNKKISCQDLTSQDFEKLGEYFMGQMAGSPENHFYMDQRVEQMMGREGLTQMHIVMGQRLSRCNTNASFPSNTPSFITGMMGNFQGGVNPMMGWGNLGMMGFGGSGWSWAFLIIFYIAVIVDLILLGLWLWKQINRK